MSIGIGSDRITPSYFVKWIYEPQGDDSQKIKQLKSIVAFIFSIIAIIFIPLFYWFTPLKNFTLHFFILSIFSALFSLIFSVQFSKKNRNRFAFFGFIMSIFSLLMDGLFLVLLFFILL